MTTTITRETISADRPSKAPYEFIQSAIDNARVTLERPPGDIGTNELDFSSLSDSELVVLDMVSRGLSTEDIIRELGYTTGTIHNIRSDILHKTNGRKMPRVVAEAYYAGIFNGTLPEYDFRFVGKLSPLLIESVGLASRGLSAKEASRVTKDTGEKNMGVRRSRAVMILAAGSISHASRILCEAGLVVPVSVNVSRWLQLGVVNEAHV